MSSITVQANGKSSFCKKKDASDSLISFGLLALTGNTSIMINKGKLNEYLFQIPEERRGDWYIHREIYGAESSQSDWVKVHIEHNEHRYPGLKAGDNVTMLKYKDKVVMSPSAAELADHYNLLTEHAYGHIHINGLGLGIIPYILDKMDNVERITIYERSSEVLELVQETLLKNTSKVKVYKRNAFLGPSSQLLIDYVWHDIWSDISSNNLKGMKMLCKIWEPFCYMQDCWTQEDCRIMDIKNELLRNRAALELI